MEVTAQRTGLMYRPEGLVVAFLVAVVVWRFGVGPPVQWVLLTITGLFLFALNRPVWAMAAFLVSLLTVNNYMVTTPFTISLRLLLLVLALAVVWFTLGRRGIELGPRAKLILVPATIFVGLSLIANLVNSDTDFAYQDFRQMLVGLLIIILLPAVTRNLRDLKILCGVALVVMATSAAVAIMQHYNLLGMGGQFLNPSVYASTARAPGMAETPLELSFVLTSALPVLVGIYLMKGVKSGTLWFLGLAVVMVLMATYFSYTRSALLGLAIGLVVVTLLLGRHMRGKVILAIIILSFVVYQVTIVQNSRLASSSDTSAASREVLRQAGIAIAIDNPILGIGGNNFKTVSLQYASEVDPEALRYAGAGGDLGVMNPHNDYIRLAVFYGIPALIVYFWLLVALLFCIRASHRATSRRFIKGLSIGLVGAIVAYGVNAYYHNLLSSMPLLWVLAGFSLATAKLALAEKKPSQKVISPG